MTTFAISSYDGCLVRSGRPVCVWIPARGVWSRFHVGERDRRPITCEEPLAIVGSEDALVALPVKA